MCPENLVAAQLLKITHLMQKNNPYFHRILMFITVFTQSYHLLLFYTIRIWYVPSNCSKRSSTILAFCLRLLLTLRLPPTYKIIKTLHHRLMQKNKRNLDVSFGVINEGCLFAILPKQTSTQSQLFWKYDIYYRDMYLVRLGF